MFLCKDRKDNKLEPSSVCVCVWHQPDLGQDDAGVERRQQVWQGLQVRLMADARLQSIHRHLLRTRLHDVTQGLHLEQGLVLHGQSKRAKAANWRHKKIKFWRCPCQCAASPVWLRAWCARCSPCSRPPGSEWNVNSQMARGFLTCDSSHNLRSNTGMGGIRCRRVIFVSALFFCKIYFRCQNRKCPILLLDSALSNKKVVRSQSR